ncbi:MAG: site-2 protease family protein, partial [Pseudomonadota bacterium]
SNEEGRRTFDYQVSQDLLDPETGYLKFLPAIRFFYRIRRGVAAITVNRRLRGESAPRANRDVAVDVQRARLANDFQAYREFTAITAPTPMTLVRKVLFFILSGLLFAWAFGLIFSPVFGVLLLVVVAIHELGHLLAMRIFGYRDLSVFFIPLFGALAKGRKPRASLYEKTVISLAGPVPGLLVGVWLIEHYGTSNRAMFMAGALFLIINYLNLLPFMPLDGGQILNNALFARRHRLQAVFTLISVLALLAVAVSLREPIAFAIAIALLWVARSQFVRAKLLGGRDLRPLQGMGEDDALRYALHQFDDLRSRAGPFRFQMVRSVLQEYGQAPPTVTAQIGVLLVYGLALVSPFLMSDTVLVLVARIF